MKTILYLNLICDLYTKAKGAKQNTPGSYNHAMAEETEIVQGKFIFFYRRVVHIHDMHAACFPSV